MIFPIGDDQVKGGHFPLFAYGFIALNVVAWFIQMQDGSDLLVCDYGAIPANILNGNDYHTLFTSMFMHGGWMHIIGNMLFMWIFADNIEATIGSFKFVLFYFAGGLAAVAAHIFLGTGTEVAGCCYPCGNAAGIQCAGNMASVCAGSVPMVGASGALSAVMGAYLVMFPKSRVKILVIYFFRSFFLPAYVFLGFWIAMQLFSGFSALGSAAGGGTAWWAHIGGFAFGVVLGFMFREKGGIFFKDDKRGPQRPSRGDFV